MASDQAISSALNNLVGAPAWGLKRTHGSMFFLEFGKSVDYGANARGEKRVHGEWHFLFESCHWRISGAQGIVIGSEDDTDLIDEVFSDLMMGEVEQATLDETCHDLKLLFTPGYKVETFSACSSQRTDWTEWLLFTPGEVAWTKRAVGAPSGRNTHEIL